jgi:hypothetical protein
MLAPSLPLNISERLYPLHSLDILGSPLQGNFERITRLAQSLFDVPIAFISLIVLKFLMLNLFVTMSCPMKISLMYLKQLEMSAFLEILMF